MKIDNLKLKIKDILFFTATTAIILGLNLTPLIVHITHAPAGRSFGLIHNNVQDFYFYQALMNEGANGATLTYDPYTSEPHQPSIIFSYFLALGKISKLFGLPLAITYHLTRIILGFLLLLTSYYLILHLKIPYPRLTYLFFLFAAPFMHIINDYGKFISVPYMNWWNGVDPIRRAAFLPHHMLGGFLLILSIILIFKLTNTADRQYLSKIILGRKLLLLILLSAVMAYVHTPSLLIMLLILPSSIILHLIFIYFNHHLKFSIFNFSRLSGIPQATGQFSINFKNSNIKNLDFNKNFKFQISNYIGLFVYWIIGLFFLFAMILQTKNGFPWSQYIDWEKGLQFPLDRELIGALGILLPFSIVGIYHAFRSRKFENIFIVCWLIVPFLFIPIAPKLNLSNIRLIQGMPYLPLAILSILGIEELRYLFTKHFLESAKCKNQSAKSSAKLKAFNFKLGFEFFALNFELDSSRISNILLLIILAIFFIFTLPALKWSLKDQIREYLPIYGNVYLDKRLNSAFDFINKNFPAKTVTLSTLYTGNYLPVYTHLISFIGHFGYTYNEKTKEENAQKFFEGKMTVEEAKNLLSNNKITLVFQGPEEKPLYKDYLYPTLLKVVYDKEEVTLYTFIQTIK